MSRWLSDRPSPLRRRRPIGPLEHLEGRALLATFTWASPTSGDFAVAANWDLPNGMHSVPGPNDDVATPAGDYTITSPASETVNSFNGGAKLDVEGGTFALVNRGAGDGMDPVSTLASLTVAVGGTFITGDDITNPSAATTAIDGGSIAGRLDSEAFDPIDGPIGANGVTELTGVALEGGAQLTGRFVDLANIAIDGPVALPDMFAVEAGSGVAMTGPGPVILPKGSMVNWGSGTLATKSVTIDGYLSINGPFVLDGATVSNGGVIALSDGIDFLDGATLDNQSGAAVAIFDPTLLTGGSTGTFVNSGDLNVFGGPSSIAVNFSNDGGAIAVDAPLTLPGFTNAGQIDLDPNGSMDGILSVAGDYTQTPSGVLVDNLNSPPTQGGGGGTLAVSGVATFGGTLEVVNRTESPFLPTSGQEFPLATFASSTGRFASIDFPSRGGLSEYVLVPSATGDDLVAQALPPTGLQISPGIQTADSGSTIQDLPEFVGQADPGSLVQIYDSAGRLIAGSGPVAPYGSADPGAFTATPTAPLAPGTYVVRAIEIENGAYGLPGSPYTLTIQAPPAAPTGLAILPADDDGGPGVTTLTRPRLTGHDTPGLLVQVYDLDDGRLVASGTADSTGTFVAQPSEPLPFGPITLEAVAVNATGGYGPDGAPIRLTIAPEAPPTGLALLPADDTAGAGVTAIHAPRVTGKATPGLLVQIYEQTGTPDAKLVGSAVANSSGTFVAQLEPALAPGSYTLEAIAIAPDELYGAAGSPFTLTISPPPPAPTGLTLVASSDTQGPGKTSIATPQLAGTSTAGLQIQVYDSGTLVAWGEVGPDGTFVTRPSKSLAVGVHALEAIAIDAGGNYGAAGAPFRLTVT